MLRRGFVGIRIDIRRLLLVNRDAVFSSAPEAKRSWPRTNSAVAALPTTVSIQPDCFDFVRGSERIFVIDCRLS